MRADWKFRGAPIFNLMRQPEHRCADSFTPPDMSQGAQLERAARNFGTQEKSPALLRPKINLQLRGNQSRSLSDLETGCEISDMKGGWATDGFKRILRTSLKDEAEGVTREESRMHWLQRDDG